MRDINGKLKKRRKTDPGATLTENEQKMLDEMRNHMTIYRRSRRPDVLM